MHRSIRRVLQLVPAALITFGGAVPAGIGLVAWNIGGPFHAERVLLPLGAAAAGLGGSALWNTVAHRWPTRLIWFTVIGLTGAGAAAGAAWASGRIGGPAWWVLLIPLGALAASGVVWLYDRTRPDEVRRSLTAPGTVVADDPAAGDVQHVFEFRDVRGQSHRFPWRTARRVRSGDRCRIVYDPGPPVKIRTVKLPRRR